MTQLQSKVSGTTALVEHWSSRAARSSGPLRWSRQQWHPVAAGLPMKQYLLTVDAVCHGTYRCISGVQPPVVSPAGQEPCNTHQVAGEGFQPVLQEQDMHCRTGTECNLLLSQGSLLVRVLLHILWFAYMTRYLPAADSSNKVPTCRHHHMHGCPAGAGCTSFLADPPASAQPTPRTCVGGVYPAAQAGIPGEPGDLQVTPLSCVLQLLTAVCSFLPDFATALPGCIRLGSCNDCLHLFWQYVPTDADCAVLLPAGCELHQAVSGPYPLVTHCPQQP